MDGRTLNVSDSALQLMSLLASRRNLEHQSNEVMRYDTCTVEQVVSRFASFSNSESLQTANYSIRISLNFLLGQQRSNYNSSGVLSSGYVVVTTQRNDDNSVSMKWDRFRLLLIAGDIKQYVIYQTARHFCVKLHCSVNQQFARSLLDIYSL